MSKLAVLNTSGKEEGSVELPDEVFSGRVNSDILHQTVVMYRACLRQGNASTKERADVRGGGAKPFRQKGTGRARAGSSRSPLWKGGGVTFGPHKRDFSYTVPKRIKKSALKESLKAKFQDENLHCVNDLKDPLEKTKDFALILKGFKMQGKTLGILDGSDPSIQRVSRNIPSFILMRSQDVNAYDILRNKNVVVSQTGLKNLLDRIKKLGN